MVAKIDTERLEEGNELLIDFAKLDQVAQCGEAVVPVAVQDADTKEVLIVAYVNETALNYTLEHGVAAFWSTSRNKLWVKGETSGDTLQLVEVRVNCEQNSLVYIVRPLGEGACHTKCADGTARRSCYYRRIKDWKLEHAE
jgi:phosphoribosyl-AMP cyclohydrolase